MLKYILALVSVTCLVLPVGCIMIPAEIDTILGQEFILRPGQSASITGEDLKIEFQGIINDSRCPGGVVCFWQGEVSCLVEISHAGVNNRKVLVQSGSSSTDTAFGNYLITFNVQPYPQAGKVIDDGDYRLHLVISKRFALSGGILATFDVLGKSYSIFITNTETIEQVFALRRGESQANIPSGRILRGSVSYNDQWSWHIDPEDIHMAEITIELCDGTPSQVEANVDYWVNTVKRFCPWQAKLVNIVDYRTPGSNSLPEIKYLLFSRFDVFWCDPYLYPISRPGQEKTDALAQFPAIRADETEFTAILEHLGLPDKASYTSEEKLLIFREHRMLTLAVQVTSAAGSYNFTLRVDEDQGERIEGTITLNGEINVLKREAAFNTCPICLAQGTLIDTPSGQVPVERLQKGMTIWTVESSGNRIPALVVETSATPVLSSFQIIRLSLSDGRAVEASPLHPTADGRALVDLRIGDTIDGAKVVSIDYSIYDGAATFDILPSGETGFYRANGILLKSSLGVSELSCDCG